MKSFFFRNVIKLRLPRKREKRNGPQKRKLFMLNNARKFFKKIIKTDPRKVVIYSPARIKEGGIQALFSG